jgi:hypothetical protein
MPFFNKFTDRERVFFSPFDSSADPVQLIEFPSEARQTNATTRWRCCRSGLRLTKVFRETVAAMSGAATLIASAEAIRGSTEVRKARRKWPVKGKPLQDCLKRLHSPKQTRGGKICVVFSVSGPLVYRWSADFATDS